MNDNLSLKMTRYSYAHKKPGHSKKIVSFLLLFFCCFSATYAQQTVSGKVTYADTAVAGASVTVKGTNTGVQTDANGLFTIKAPANATLIISYIGFATKEVAVDNRSSITIQLEVSSSQLEQIVVTGYTSQRKKDLTGAVAVVDVNSLKAQPAGSAAEALQGKAAGVNIINDGSPGSTPQIRIRGYSTINNNDPLYIVDGVPYQGKLSWLNQNDIQTMQVLKDASAASIYGSRANNGVVIITTKKGREGAPQITLDAYYGV